MTEQQIPKLAAALVEYQSDFAELPTDDAQWVIQNTKSAIRLFCKAVRDRFSNSFQTWRTIKLGTHRDISALRTDLKKAKRQISDWAKGILGKITLSNVEYELELVLVSVRELGFKKSATLKEIFDRALELGLDLCPAEVGPQLALQYLNQPLGEWIRIAMELVTDSGGGLDLFVVEHDGDGLWLCACYGGPGCFWDPGDRFVFVRRK
jgi:hypothetical protein